MTDATALEALAVRVEAGETGGRVDIDVARLLGLEPTVSDGWQMTSAETHTWHKNLRHPVNATFAQWDDVWQPARVSTSLDACAALAERVLPGTAALSSGKSTAHEGKYWCLITRPVTDIAGTWTRREASVEAPTECAARLASILRAKAKEAE